MIFPYLWTTMGYILNPSFNLKETCCRALCNLTVMGKIVLLLSNDSIGTAQFSTFMVLYLCYLGSRTMRCRESPKWMLYDWNSDRRSGSKVYQIISYLIIIWKWKLLWTHQKSTTIKCNHLCEGSQLLFDGNIYNLLGGFTKPFEKNMNRQLGSYFPQFPGWKFKTICNITTNW